MNYTIPSSPADRLAMILERLHQALGRHADAQRLIGRGSIIGPFLIQIWQRVSRIGLRFTLRAAREPVNPQPSRIRLRFPLRAAREPVPKSVIASEARQSRSAPQPQSSNPQPKPLPRNKAWLLNLIPETAPIMGQLLSFLKDPEAAAFLLASPRLCSILNPLCHMLGIPAASIQAANTQAAAIQRAKALAAEALAAEALAAEALSTTTPPPSQPPEAPPVAPPIQDQAPEHAPEHAPEQAPPTAPPPEFLHTQA